MIGRVKWFNNFKGYGFLEVDDMEVFVHYSQILTKRYKTLSQNEIVRIGNIIKTDNGYQAQAVRKKSNIYLR